jgi:hypothetical protein
MKEAWAPPHRRPGHTLYSFAWTARSLGCSGNCIKNWTALLRREGRAHGGMNDQVFGTITRGRHPADTYKGIRCTTSSGPEARRQQRPGRHRGWFVSIRPSSAQDVGAPAACRRHYLPPGAAWKRPSLREGDRGPRCRGRRSARASSRPASPGLLRGGLFVGLFRSGGAAAQRARRPSRPWAAQVDVLLVQGLHDLGREVRAGSKP